MNTKIVDLSIPVSEKTPSPPFVNLQLQLTIYHRGPGFWHASKIEMLLHTGSHVEFRRHVQANSEIATDVSLRRACSEALVVYLIFSELNHEISVTDMEAHAQQVVKDDIFLVRTGWIKKHRGKFPKYYLESPFCSPKAARWLIGRGARAIGF